MMVQSEACKESHLLKCGEFVQLFTREPFDTGNFSVLGAYVTEFVVRPFNEEILCERGTYKAFCQDVHMERQRLSGCVGIVE